MTETDKDKTPSTSPAMKKIATSSSSIKQAAYRARQHMPKDAGQFAAVITHMIENATPKEQSSLRNVGIRPSPVKAKRKLGQITH